MPENRVSVEDESRHRWDIRADGRAVTSVIPDGYLFYFHTIHDAPGVVAANNFMSVFNPIGSGKTVVFFQAEMASYATGASTTAVSLTATRITAASGGSLIAPADVSRFVTAWADPVAEVRVSNPTVTTSGLALNAWPPPMTTGALNGSTPYTSPPPGEGFVCAPGQGIVFSTASGNTSQMWKINTIWAEV